MTQRIIILLLLGFNFTNGQSYFEGNPKWYAVNVLDGFGGRTTSTSIYRIGKDTILDGQRYWQLEISGDADEKIWKASSDHFVRQSGDTIFLYTPTGDVQTHVNNMNVGDSFNPGELCEYEVDQVVTRTRQGFTHEYYSYIRATIDDTLVNEVGSLNALFHPEKTCIFDVGESKLQCLYRNGELVFKRYEGECYQQPTLVQEHNDARIELRPTMIMAGEPQYIVTEEDIKGVRVWDLSGHKEETYLDRNKEIRYSKRGLKVIELELEGGRMVRLRTVVQ